MSQSPTASRYLDARVLTASQPELQLLLLDGALRFGRQAEQLWNDPDQAGETSRLVGRTMDIVEELIRGVAGGGSAISKRLEEEYAFAFRQLAAALLNHELAGLEGALRLLAIERETWKLAVERLRQSGETDAAGLATASPVLGSLAGFGGGGCTLSIHG